MATLSPLSFLATTKVSASSPSLLPSSSRKPSKASHRIAKVSCNSSNPQGEPQNNRRDVLVGLGGLGAAAATFSYNPLALADAVATDVHACHKPSLPPGAKPIACCPPNYEDKEPIEYVIPKYTSLRIRTPAHDYADLDKYTKAITIMKSLPDDHPHSWTQQSRIHCAYCHNSYTQVGHKGVEMQVHFSWIFLPFHRWYLYFYERILGKLINDPTFALPFWNWDAPEGMEMPAIFTDRRSPLYNALRNQNHLPPTLVDLNWNGRSTGVDGSGDVEANLATMYRQVYEVKRPLCFYGKPYRAGDKPLSGSGNGSGSIELVPHNTVHSWTGDKTQPNIEDMGALYSAARDPIFYCHHANIDRMWSVWKSFGREDITDPDYQNASYVFYDENLNLVTVKNSDAFDTKKLGYDYKQLDLPWLKYKPTPRRTKAQRHGRKVKKLDLPFTLKDKIVSTVVKRPQTNRSQLEKDEKEESLVFTLQFDRTKHLKFDVLINEEEDYKWANPKYREFAGSFVNVSHAGQDPGATETTFTVGITDLLEQLDADDDDTIVVTLVPQYGDQVIIKDIKISFEECRLR
ncbi:polyphenol oxidase, chloroplastic-like [Arachis stenosperma]|uniref:polyphenol oxidase, chloroplastic-like n=1 Tax=Arachis stenosperma TaxID=217475 RepID=UPI0025AD563E|nr:polyphenol oxidase, chloroplastic-like [Arachis stenosperma]